MLILNKDELLNKKHAMVKKLRNSIFIYPTDTIYGIGCDATNEVLVNKIREIKQRFDLPFSVIAPSKDWIADNCVIKTKTQSWLNNLPGPYTLILALTNKNCIAQSVNLKADNLGVRLPENWFTEVVADIGVPIVTTSANVTGQDFLTSIDDLSPVIKEQVDFFIDDGVINGRPSTLIYLDKGGFNLKRR
jgi:tRNA threonylcarbamoyl adenosine modification protein (Sua5/YciO/YrdC/YwlC family)